MSEAGTNEGGYELIEDSDVSFVTTKPGDATNFPRKACTVSVHYIGKLAADQSTFDSSLERNTPLQFKIGVGQVIRAWEETIPKMSVGQRIQLTVPPAKGYGMNGYPPIIPGGATLMYEIELLSFSSP